MKVHVLQHVPFEDIGSIAPWLKEHDAEVSRTRFFENPALPGPENFDLIIAMGGPMSVNDELDLPWLRDEKQFIRDAIADDVAVLGVCLGAQLIASALGSRVYRNAEKEIGWFPIEAAAPTSATFTFAQTSNVFHWHGETFDLPSGAVLLAQSAVCRNQAFQLKQNVIGLQFHLEVTIDGVRALLENCAGDLAPGRYVQSKAELSAVPPEAYAELNRLMDRVLSYLFRQ